MADRAETERKLQRALERADVATMVRLDPPSVLGLLLRRARLERLYQGPAIQGQTVRMGGMEVGRG